MKIEREGWEGSSGERDGNGRLVDSILAHLIAFELPGRLRLEEIVKDYGLDGLEAAAQMQTQIITQTENKFLQFSERVLELHKDQGYIDQKTGLANELGMGLETWKLAHSIFRDYAVDLSKPETCDVFKDLPMLVVIFFDVIGLKIVNDLKSRLDGDKLIQTVARVLASSFRQNDLLGRMGQKSDEFVAIIRIEPDEAESFMNSILDPSIAWDPEKQMGRIPHIFSELNAYRNEYILPYITQEAFDELADSHPSDERLHTVIEGVGSVAVGIVPVSLGFLVSSMCETLHLKEPPGHLHQVFIDRLIAPAETQMKLAKKESRMTGRNYAAISIREGSVKLVDFPVT